MWQHFTSKRTILTAYNLSSSTRRLKSTKSLLNLSINENTNIATLELNRPPVNSLNVALFKEACDVLDDLAKYRPNGLVLTSTSTTVFSAGLDFKELYKSTPERVSIFWTAFQDLWLKLYGSSFPTVAAINGHAVAGGCVLALCCDYRVMLPRFTIGLTETKVGIVVPQWIQASMRNVLSTRETEKALTLGITFNTDEALKIGLIDEIVNDKTDALKQSEKFLLKFANIPYDIRAMMKKMLRGRDLTELENNRDADQQSFLDNVFEPNFQKTLELYMEGIKKKKS